MYIFIFLICFVCYIPYILNRRDYSIRGFCKRYGIRNIFVMDSANTVCLYSGSFADFERKKIYRKYRFFSDFSVEPVTIPPSFVFVLHGRKTKKNK